MKTILSLPLVVLAASLTCLAQNESPILYNSRVDGDAYTTSNKLTNPAAGTDLINVHATGSKSLFFERAILTCTVNCEFSIIIATGLGSGCSSWGAYGLRGGFSIGGQISGGGTSIPSTATVNRQCSVDTAIGGQIDIKAPANESKIIDLQGLIGAASSDDGVSCRITTAVGTSQTAKCELWWYEN